MADQKPLYPQRRARKGAEWFGMVSDPWETERSDPLIDICGWWPETRYPVVTTMAMRRSKPKDPKWRITYISPIAPMRKVGYFDSQRADGRNVGNVGATWRVKTIMEKAQRRREALLRLLAQGMTVAEALGAPDVDVKVNTYHQWRRRYPEWATKVDTVRHETADDRGEQDENFYSRRRYYFGYETYAHQRTFIEAIEATPDGGITLILLPPEAGKTTTLSNWCTDKIAQDPNERILYVSETADGHARKVLDEIKQQMTDPNLEMEDTQYQSHIPEFIARYGPFRDPAQDRGKPWNNRYIKVHKARGGHRDYTFQAIGWKSKIYGARATWIIIDDVQSSESINSTDRILAVLRRTFFTRTRKGKMVFIGTRIDLGDVYEMLEQEGIPSQIVKIPAVDDEGNSYWPERWSREDLAQKKEMAQDGWWAVYMMAPQLQKAATFTPAILEPCFDVTMGLGMAGVLVDYRRVAGLDPALTGPAALGSAAFNAKKFVLLDMQVRMQLGSNEAIMAWLGEVARVSRFTELVVENSAVSQGFIADARLARMKDLYGFSIVQHATTQATKEDLDWGIAEMAGSFMRGEIVLPYGDGPARAAVDKLCLELYRWRAGMQGKKLTQDQVIALWVMWRRWQVAKQDLVQDDGDLGAWKTRGVPWVPGDMSGTWRVDTRQSPPRVGGRAGGGARRESAGLGLRREW